MASRISLYNWRLLIYFNSPCVRGLKTALGKKPTQQQSGAVEACWAHNPEVRGSKPRSAKDNNEGELSLFFFNFFLHPRSRHAYHSIFMRNKFFTIFLIIKIHASRNANITLIYHPSVLCI